MTKTKVVFTKRNSYGRKLYETEYSLGEMVKCKRGYVLKTTHVMKGFKSQERMDLYNKYKFQLNLALSGYKKYWSMYLKEQHNTRGL